MNLIDCPCPARLTRSWVVSGRCVPYRYLVVQHSDSEQLNVAVGNPQCSALSDDDAEGVAVEPDSSGLYLRPQFDDAAHLLLRLGLSD